MEVGRGGGSSGVGSDVNEELFLGKCKKNRGGGAGGGGSCRGGGGGGVQGGCK